jgi:uncharacterized protein (DUF433 family)
MQMSLVIADTPIPLTADSHGTIRVGGTRVTLDALVAAFAGGATAEEIVQRYPSLDLGDVYAVIGFYLHHREEVDAYLEQQDERASLSRRKHELRFDQSGVRERLLARRSRVVS